MSKKKKGKDIKDEKTIIQRQTQNQKISVIIPVYNEDTDTVSKVVSDILNGAGDELLEILVVDDGSEKFDFSYPDTRVKLLKKEHGGKGSAIKFGAEKAKGDILVFTDGDGELLVEWKDVENAVKLMEERNVQAIFGVRRFKGSGSPLWHRFLNRAFSVFVSFVTLKWCSDVLCGFRVVKREEFIRFYEKRKADGYEFELDTFITVKSKIFTIPIIYEKKNKNSPTLTIILNILNHPLVISSMLFFVVFSFLFLFFKYSLLVISDDFAHLARAKYNSFFGLPKLTLMQEENPVNYAWFIQFLLSFAKISEEAMINALILFKIFLLFIFFSSFIRNSTNLIKPILGLIIILLIKDHMNVGRVLSISLISVFLQIYDRIYCAHKYRSNNYLYIFIIAALQIIWSNSHILFISGIVIPIIFFVWRRKRLYFISVLVNLFASLINPYHIHLLIYAVSVPIFLTTSGPHRNIPELYPLAKMLYLASTDKYAFVLFLYYIVFSINISAMIFANFKNLIFPEKFFAVSSLLASFFLSFRFIELTCSIAPFCKINKKIFVIFLLLLPRIFFSMEGHFVYYQVQRGLEYLGKECKGVFIDTFGYLASPSIFYLYPAVVPFVDFFSAFNKPSAYEIITDYEKLKQEIVKDERIKCVSFKGDSIVHPHPDFVVEKFVIKKIR